MSGVFTRSVELCMSGVCVESLDSAASGRKMVSTVPPGISVDLQFFSMFARCCELPQNAYILQERVRDHYLYARAHEDSQI